MPMRGISLDIHEVPAYATTIIAGQLSTVAGDIRSLRVPLERAVDKVVRPRIAENFATQSEALARDWEDLSDVTVTDRGLYRGRHDAFGRPKLDVTGTLKGVAQSKSLWKFDGQRGEAFIPAGAFAGTPVEEYAYSMQFGGPNVRPYSDPPARPYIAINEQDEEDINEIFADWIEERLNVVMTGGRARALTGAFR